MEENYLGDDSALKLHELVKKDKKPFLEMDVTTLVEANILTWVIFSL